MVTVQLNGVITITDNQTGSVQLQKQVVGSYNGTVSEFAQNVILASGSTSITLPGSPTNFVYFRNLSSVSGSTVTVTWTPNGGSSNPVALLEPGGFIILDESITGGGITALSVNAAVASTPCEYILVA